MPSATPNVFSPPTPEQVQRHLRRYPIRGRSALINILPALLLVGVGLLVWGSSQHPIQIVLACLVIIGFFGVQTAYRWWERDLQARALYAHELMLLRNWPQSFRLAWRTLPSLTSMPELHGRTIAVMAHDLDQLKAYDAAITAYDFLIDYLPPEHPLGIQFRIHRALAQFASDSLTDADQTLRRLRGQMDFFKGTPTWALYRLAMLVQEVRTNHYADAIARAPALLEDLRPLGIEAAYGYALMALAYARQAITPEANPQSRDEAQAWWTRATLLLPVPALLDRFPDLEFMTRPAPPEPPPPESGGPQQSQESAPTP